jgi:hypothetical protein
MLNRIFIVALSFYLVVAGVAQVQTVYATANPMSQLVTPTTTLSLVANTPAQPTKPAGWGGRVCNVTIWNNTATPVYIGGPPGPGGTTVLGTATVGAGMPICTDTAVCVKPLATVDASLVGLIAGVNVSGIRYFFGGGC